MIEQLAFPPLARDKEFRGGSDPEEETAKPPPRNCTICGQWKSASEFWSRSDERPGIWRSYCKACGISFGEALELAEALQKPATLEELGEA